MGWGVDLSPTFSAKKKFYLDFRARGKWNDPGTPQEKANNLINRISQEYSAPYNLCLSGGVDSQTMLWFWHHSGVDFEIYTARYFIDNKVVNDHDYDFLFKFMESNQISNPVNFIDIDIIDFLENHHKSYALKYQTWSPHLTTHMQICDRIPNGTKILSGNFLSDLYYTYSIYGLYRYAQEQGNTIPFFLSEDPVLAAVTQNPNINLIHSTLNEYEKKIANLEHIGIPVISQEYPYTGFEKVKEYYDQFNHRVSAKEKLKYSHMPSKRVFDQLFRYSLMQEIPYVDELGCIW